MTKARYEIHWRESAVEDLEAIVLYIGQDSLERALAFAELIETKTELLRDFPEAGRAGGRPEMPEWMRELVVHANYIVFYRVHHQHRQVEVFGVKHAAQQLP